MQRLWLEATREDFSLSVFTQVIELADMRQRLREELGLDGHPQVMVRMGRGSQTPPSRRRSLDEVLDLPGATS